MMSWITPLLLFIGAFLLRWGSAQYIGKDFQNVLGTMVAIISALMLVGAVKVPISAVASFLTAYLSLDAIMDYIL